MAQIVIFPDQASFEAGIEALQSAKISFEAIEPPDFCKGLTATSILVAGMSSDILGILESRGVFVSGIVPHVIFRKRCSRGRPSRLQVEGNSRRISNHVNQTESY